MPITRMIPLIAALVSLSAYSNPLKTCEFIEMKGRAFSGLAKINLQFLLLPSTQGRFFQQKTYISTPFGANDMSYKVFSRTDKDIENLEMIERIKYHPRSQTEIKRNKVFLDEAKNFFLFSRQQTDQSSPYKVYGDSIVRGQTLDLVSMLYYLRQLPLNLLSEKSEAISLYLMGPKGSMDQNGTPKEYSRMTFHFSESQREFKIEAKFDPLPGDPVPDESKEYEYAYFTIGKDEHRTPVQLRLKIKGNPEFKVSTSRRIQYRQSGEECL